MKLALNENRFHPFRFQRVQSLNPEVSLLLLNFCQWVLQQQVLQPDFTAHILFTDEAVFTREAVFNGHSFHLWATNNQHATRPHAYQQRFSVNLWEGIGNNYLIG